MPEQLDGPAVLTRRALRLARQDAERAAAQAAATPRVSTPPAAAWTSPADEARRLAQYAFAAEDAASGPARDAAAGRAAPALLADDPAPPSWQAAAWADYYDSLGSLGGARAERAARADLAAAATRSDTPFVPPRAIEGTAESGVGAAHLAGAATVRGPETFLAAAAAAAPTTVEAFQPRSPESGEDGLAPDAAATRDGGRQLGSLEALAIADAGAFVDREAAGVRVPTGREGSTGPWFASAAESPLDGVSETVGTASGDEETFSKRWAPRLPRVSALLLMFDASARGAAILERVRLFLRRHTRQAAAAAVATLLAGSAVIGLSGAAKIPALAGEDALAPLAQTIEMVSRRQMADLTSRTMTAHLIDGYEASGTDPAVSTDQQSNVGLVLYWDTSALADEPDAVLLLRRGLGDAAPQTPAEGVEVALGDEPGTVCDTGLQPDTSYSYTLFIQRPGEKPEVLSQVVGTTSRYPTELLPGSSLAVGDRLTSLDNSFFVAVADDGAVVLFNNLNQKIWSLDADPDSAAALTLTQAGELVVAVDAKAVWTADTSKVGARLVLTDDGELELLAADGAVAWSSEDSGYQLRGGDSPYTVSASGWTQPGAGPVGSPYGMRIHPIYGVLKHHGGIDMTSGRGRPIYAAHDGVVTRVYCDSGGNWTIEIDHGGSVFTRYLHMDGLGGILVREGDNVVAGEQIARTGSSGQSTGPHLHFEVSVNGSTVDPVPFLKNHGVTLR
ncbi:MAG: peptidoglycan DD-metalloendopeptidase family protein [Bifidobacteriaceae bacterium]|jgi:murein DD-endopeptidase MepM/ murein hydrolase activator NlpD|nr:peptidoglycan DD-metalloendopeptidase family protein [Bifidobacteriaceae bacterium]